MRKTIITLAALILSACSYPGAIAPISGARGSVGSSDGLSFIPGPEVGGGVELVALPSFGSLPCGPVYRAALSRTQPLQYQGRYLG